MRELEVWLEMHAQRELSKPNLLNAKESEAYDCGRIDSEIYFAREILNNFFDKTEGEAL